MIHSDSVKQWEAETASYRAALATRENEIGHLRAENERLRKAIEDAINTLEAMDLHVCNPLYERLYKTIER